MIDERTVLMTLGGTLALGLATITYLQHPLRRILLDICRKRDHARFWAACANVLLLALPLSVELLLFDLRPWGESNLFWILNQVKWGLLGLVVAQTIVRALFVLSVMFGTSFLIEFVLQFQGVPDAVEYWAGIGGFILSGPYVALVRLFDYVDARTRREGWDIQVRFFDGIAGAHATQLAPGGRLGFLGNLSQNLLFYDPRTLVEVARVSTLRFGTPKVIYESQTHVAWLDDRRFVTAIGEHFFLFSMDDLQHPEKPTLGVLVYCASYDLGERDRPVDHQLVVVGSGRRPRGGPIADSDRRGAHRPLSLPIGSNPARGHGRRPG